MLMGARGALAIEIVPVDMRPQRPPARTPGTPRS